MESKNKEGRLLPPQACLLIYDGECRLCVSVKMALEQREVNPTRTGIQFVAYQSKAARIALGQRYRSGRPETAFFIQPSGKVLQGLAAFFPILPYIWGGRLVLWGLRFHMVRQLAEWGYRFMARHRYRWFGVAQSIK